MPAIDSSFLMCSFSSSTVSPWRATSLVEHKIRALGTSSASGPMIPFCLRLAEVDRRARDLEREFLRLALSSIDLRAILTDGRTSFFCLVSAGRISSRSTGTPRETRKRRRIRDIFQLGGCNGGGAES